MAFNLADFIIKPSAPFTTGVVLFGAVWSFFKGAESVLKDDTKLEIAIWLLGVDPLGPKMQPWPSTFAKVFDSIFGSQHLSWKCFRNSVIASYSVFLIAYAIEKVSLLITRGVRPTGSDLAMMCIVYSVSAAADYFSLLETRRLLGFMIERNSGTVDALVVSVDLCFTTILATVIMVVCIPIGAALLTTIYPMTVYSPSNLFFVGVPEMVNRVIQSLHGYPTYFLRFDWPVYVLWFIPAFFSSIWLWLYAGSGFLLKLCRRFDIGFRWFNSKVDIEHKPLSAIGLVAASLVALLWWTAKLVEWAV